MSGKLTEVHQSNVLDWVMHNLDPPNAAPSIPYNRLFYTYATKETIIEWILPSTISQMCHCGISTH